jgi:hypothetical protein
LIDVGETAAHKLIPDNVTTFNLVFSVGLSLEVDKWRGLFDNTVGTIMVTLIVGKYILVVVNKIMIIFVYTNGYTVL